MTAARTEWVELEAMRTVFEATPTDAAKRLELAVDVRGGALCTRGRGVSDRLMNRVIGLGLGEEASEALLDDVVSFFPRGTNWFVSLAPQARPPDVVERLRTRGFEPDYAWVKFTRRVAAAPSFATDLRVARVSASDAPAFAHVVCAAYGLDPTAAPFVGAAVTGAGFDCYLAWDGDEPAGAAALFASGDTGWFGLAGTRPEFRGRGAQSALLAVRIARAAELGCRLLVTETGEQVEERPSNSYRNILRSGFEIAYVRPNYRAP